MDLLLDIAMVAVIAAVYHAPSCTDSTPVWCSTIDNCLWSAWLQTTSISECWFLMYAIVSNASASVLWNRYTTAYGVQSVRDTAIQPPFLTVPEEDSFASITEISIYHVLSIQESSYDFFLSHKIDLTPDITRNLPNIGLTHGLYLYTVTRRSVGELAWNQKPKWDPL